MNLSEEKKSLDILANITKNLAHELSSLLSAISCSVSGVKDFVPTLINTYKLALAQGLEFPEIPSAHLQLLEKGLELSERASRNANSYLSLFLNNTFNMSTLDLHPCSIRDCLQIAIEKFPYKSDDHRSLLPQTFDRNNDFEFTGNQALTVNLFLNLFNYTIYRIQNSRKGAIQIWSEQDLAGNILYISDTAGQMTDEELDSLFNFDYGVQHHHIGLGFVFCKRLMQALKGEISCSRTSDGSLTFTLSFPLMTSN